MNCICNFDILMNKSNISNPFQKVFLFLIHITRFFFGFWSHCRLCCPCSQLVISWSLVSSWWLIPRTITLTAGLNAWVFCHSQICHSHLTHGANREIGMKYQRKKTRNIVRRHRIAQINRERIYFDFLLKFFPKKSVSSAPPSVHTVVTIKIFIQTSSSDFVSLSKWPSVQERSVSPVNTVPATVLLSEKSSKRNQVKYLNETPQNFFKDQGFADKGSDKILTCLG